MRYTFPRMRGPVYKIISILLGVLLSLPLTLGAENPPEDVVWMMGRAMRAYNQKDYGGAKIALGHVMAMKPNYAEAYVLKGLLDYKDGNIEKAEASLDKALELDPTLTDSVRKQMEKEAHAIESKLTQQDFSHFKLQFNGAQRREEAWQAVKYLDEAYRDLGSRFEIYPSVRFPVVIFTDDEFREAWDAPIWLGGFYDTRDERIRLRIDRPAGGEEEYRQRLRHEFTHAFMHYLTKKELPVWFQEGVAEFYGYASASNGFWKSNRLDALAKMLKGVDWMTFDEMEKVLRYKDVDPVVVYLGYRQAEALVLYIAKERGDFWIPKVMDLIRKGKTFTVAFQEVVGMPPAHMLEGVRRLLS